MTQARFPQIPPQADRPTHLSLVMAAALALLCGCVATAPKVEGPKVTGAAAGGAAVGADATLQTCPEPVGTVRLQDGMSYAGNGRVNSTAGGDNMAATLAALRALSTQSGARVAAPSGGSVSLDSLRLLIQQSNCFLIVDRGLGESAADDEKGRSRTSNEVRDGVNMGPGQEVAADFVLRSSVIRFESTESSSVGGGGGSGNLLTKFVGGALSSSQSKSEAQVQLIVSDVRSKIQVAVAQGESSGKNTALATKVLGGSLGKALGGVNMSSQSKTSGTTILLQAFADAYNKLVPALVNYKTQTVKGGLGNGGTLRVQGARSDPSAVATQP